MVSSADLIYEPQAVEALLAPFADPEIGMVGAHSIPLDASDTFFGYAVNLMWSLHHDISMRDPKMGELIAFRNVFRRLNPNAICDELSVYQLVRAAGYASVYAPTARIYNKGPGAPRRLHLAAHALHRRQSADHARPQRAGLDDADAAGAASGAATRHAQLAAVALDRRCSPTRALLPAEGPGGIPVAKTR